MTEPRVHSHFGVYAFIRTNAGILLIKKERGPYTGMLDLPGGSPECLELLEETLRREVREETRCEVIRYCQLGAVSTIYKYTGDKGSESILRHLGVIYECEIKGVPTLESDGQDAGGCVWIQPEAIGALRTAPFVIKALEIASGKLVSHSPPSPSL